MYNIRVYLVKLKLLFHQQVLPKSLATFTAFIDSIVAADIVIAFVFAPDRIGQSGMVIIVKEAIIINLAEQQDQGYLLIIH